MTIQVDNNLISKVYNLVIDSPRKMPAYFTSSEEREKTFCIKFKDLTENDEYNMASAAYQLLDNYVKQFNNSSQRAWIVKLGEDAIVGSYIIAKLGKPELANQLEKKLTKENIRRFKGVSKDLDVDKTYSIEGVIRYIDYCVKAGSGLAISGELKMP
jgi:hypothetical protein|tara:strand:+ start:533 stop:1003 length:471 start_codon:yes stop_codon:yes gene_type:complete